MNLSKFLKSVDTLADTMDIIQLKMFIHDTARILPEDERESFLERMHKGIEFSVGEPEYDTSYLPEFQELKDGLSKIENGELCLSGELNWEYDDWYHSDEDEFLYQDTEGLGQIIEGACHFIHEAIDKRKYQEGHEIAKCLTGLKITVNGQYQEYSDEPLELNDLVRYGILSIDYKKLVVESLYLTYCVTTLEDRAEALYQTIQSTNIRDISLEMVMQCGEELPEFQEFLPKWITYLGKQNTTIAWELLTEAIDLSDDPAILLNSARLYYMQHPGLYKKYLYENQNIVPSDTLTSIGNEALEKIDAKYLIRSDIALLLADITLQTDGKITSDVEKYWLEAFRSKSNVTNFLRIMIECRDFSIYKDKLQEINHHSIKGNRNSYFYSMSLNLTENIQDYKQTYLIAMLNGEYKFVKEHGMNVKEALGWSSSYMKEGLSAFLLLLYNSEVLSESMKLMVTKISSSVSFSIDEYSKGLSEKITNADHEFLWNCFIESKSRNLISETETESYLTWIEHLVQKRVEGIMAANRRNYYRECAEYVAALGDVLESRGAINGKQKLLLEYKQCYSRRRAFHEELRSCGMKDRKK